MEELNESSNFSWRTWNKAWRVSHAIPKADGKNWSLSIIIHIMRHYIRYGFKDFIIATGYKSYIFKNYFNNFKKSGISFSSRVFNQKCKINILDTA